ncbi:MAG: hypothetical protein DYG89_49400 [Caldilinea sp. CFX5]|nr:hypothetical protein [Caldilinea sp. CFX5]
MKKQTDHIIDGLWNKAITPENYGGRELYYAHLFEQYRIVINAADQIIERRNTANSFFLTIHTLFITGLGVAIGYKGSLQLQQVWFVLFPLIPALSLCYLWWRITKSYSQLNTAKYKIVGEYETQLPSSPYWSAEWKALGEGKNRKLYWPLTDIEGLIPLVFGILYVSGVLIFILI